MPDVLRAGRVQRPGDGAAYGASERAPHSVTERATGAGADDRFTADPIAGGKSGLYRGIVRRIVVLLAHRRARLSARWAPDH